MFIYGVREQRLTSASATEVSVSDVLYRRQICGFFPEVANFGASWGGIYSGWGVMGNTNVGTVRHARGFQQFMNVGLDGW